MRIPLLLRSLENGQTTLETDGTMTRAKMRRQRLGINSSQVCRPPPIVSYHDAADAELKDFVAGSMFLRSDLKVAMNCAD